MSEPWTPNDGRIWHEYDGGGMPCKPDAEVAVLLWHERRAKNFRNEATPACCWLWQTSLLAAWAYDNPADDPANKPIADIEARVEAAFRAGFVGGAVYGQGAGAGPWG